ncbi:MAG: phosphoribosylformylglycinamidine synthase subunit PurQ [Nitrospinota bacterium]|nr:phosphoribosylformylglycinamidine synthase subunit PurQ [Nitrospinota bacterium]
MKIAVVRFPGSNCDHDLLHALKFRLKMDAEMVWWGKKNLDDYDAAFLAGGFSFGDYLRAGAIARFAPVMEGVAKLADSGKPVLGICNGFQILAEARLLPGALMHNKSMKFLCQDVFLKVEAANNVFTGKLHKGEVLSMPIAHMEGRYVADEATIKQLEAQDRVLLRYSQKDGSLSDDSNPNGSMGAIAGILSEKRNVAGLMPHPERVCEALLGGGEDGVKFFTSFIEGTKR